MTRKCELIRMAFDGDHKVVRFRDHQPFDSVENAWEAENNMGSMWYFYPIPFVVTETCKTVVASPDRMEYLNGKRLNTVKNFIKRVSELPEAEDMEVDELCSLFWTIWHEERA